MNTQPELEEIRVIKPFLQTYKPEHGREYHYNFTTPIEVSLERKTLSGKLKAYIDKALDLTVSLHGHDDVYQHMTIHVTSTGRRRYHSGIYEEVRLYLTEHLCAPLEKKPEKFEQIVRTIVL